MSSVWKKFIYALHKFFILTKAKIRKFPAYPSFIPKPFFIIQCVHGMPISPFITKSPHRLRDGDIHFTLNYSSGNFSFAP